MPLTYSAWTRKDKGIKTLFSFFPRSMWDKVAEREEACCHYFQQSPTNGIQDEEFERKRILGDLGSNT